LNASDLVTAELVKEIKISCNGVAELVKEIKIRS